ncbi:MAG: acetyl/propionyl/methylcrotonyl-CoA carboxylase subunit alpha, partial [Kiloniellales bacterium]
AAFAEACEEAGFVFVGPPAAAIRAMGSKSEAKRLMEKAGVPLIPGYHGAQQDAKALAKRADKIGYPLLIKAAAGGGGRGLRRVERAQDFTSALDSARREAESAFGDSLVLLERFLEQPRHVEVQVFADSHGNVIHLFERDCSLQRRHQKVIEEAPAPDLSAKLRKRLGEAAVAAARAIDYRGAGTVEFLVRGADCFFMEMNTRLQVEHPVTEMVTGLDLVEWQFRAAAGEPLPLAQKEIALNGHAVEARLYAEEPARDFLPTGGRLLHLALPDAAPDLRIESGVGEGDTVGLHYDPMIAKLVAWGKDRTAAFRRLKAALVETRIAGVATNLDFLARLAGHEALLGGEIDTGFIARHLAELVPPPAPSDRESLCMAALGEVLARRRESRAAAARSNDPWSPWSLANGWRLHGAGRATVSFLDGETRHSVEVRFRGEGFEVGALDAWQRAVATLEDDGLLEVALDGHEQCGTYLRHGPDRYLLLPGKSLKLRLHDPLELSEAADVAGARLVAPMPGKVVQLLVAPGTHVARGTPLLVLEAMKMEHSIVAPADGTVTALHYGVDELVEEGAELAAFEADG